MSGNLTLINSLAPPGIAIAPVDSTTNSVFLSGKYAYVSNTTIVTTGYEFVLRVVDISDPTNPAVVGTYTSTSFDFSFSVFVADQYAYVAERTGGLQIIDVSTPASPALVGTLSIADGSSSVVVAGNYAYITDTSNAVRIVNVTDPANPALVGTYTSSVNPYSQREFPNIISAPTCVAVSGRYLYVGNFSAEIEVVDISNPTTPVLVGRYYGDDFLSPNASPRAGVPFSPIDMVAVGNYLYVADEDNGFYILDVSIPNSPSLVGSYDPGGFESARYTSVKVAGNFAYLTDVTGALVQLNISDPTNPILVSKLPIGPLNTAAGFAQGLAVGGNYAYVADGSNGLDIVRIGAALPPAGVQSLVAAPNTSELGPGGTVTLTLNFSEAVTVNTSGGAPTLALNDGGVATYDATNSNPSAGSLVFDYTVGALGSGQNTSDLALAATNALSLNGATIADTFGTPANLSGANGYNPAGTLQIDTTPPTVTSITATTDDGLTTVDAGHVITIVIVTSEIVNVTGMPTLQLNDGEEAKYVGGTGTKTLTFTYVVQPGDSVSDLRVLGFTPSIGPAIQDGAGNNLGPASQDFGLQVVTAPEFKLPFGPFPTATITQSYGEGDHGGVGSNPFDQRLYYSVDFSLKFGTPVLAEGSGIVVNVSDITQDTKNGAPTYKIVNGVLTKIKSEISHLGPHSLGNYVTIRYDNGVYATYAHLEHTNKPAVSVNDRVVVGETIGLVGDTGAFTGTHLHVTYGVSTTNLGTLKHPDLIADGAFADNPNPPVVFPALADRKPVDGQSVTGDNTAFSVALLTNYMASFASPGNGIGASSIIPLSNSSTQEVLVHAHS